MPDSPARRVEQAFPPEVLPLAQMVPGYDRNWDAARVTLAWLRDRFAVDPVIGGAIESLRPLPSDLLARTTLRPYSRLLTTTSPGKLCLKGKGFVPVPASTGTCGAGMMPRL